MPDTPYIFVVIIFCAVSAYLLYNLLKTRSLKEVFDMLSGGMKPGRSVCETTVGADEPFRLHYDVAGEKSLKAYLRYSVTYRWDSERFGNDEDAYGVVIRGTIEAAGGPPREISLGFGSVIHAEITPFTGISYGGVYRRSGDLCTYRVTAPLCRVEGNVPGARVVFSGTVTQSRNVERSTFIIFLTG